MATQKCAAQVCVFGVVAVLGVLYLCQRIPTIMSRLSLTADSVSSNSRYLVELSNQPSIKSPNTTSRAKYQDWKYLTLLLPHEDPKDIQLRQEHTFRINPAFRKSTCPVSLQIKMKDTDWTSDIYHPEIHILMNEQLLDRSEYERLLPYLIPYGYKSLPSPFPYDDVARILSLFPAAESIFEFHGQRRPTCLRCAVVGNGGILKGSSRGMEIDDHHMVFRVNNALRRGHETDVGNRTTHYFFFDRSLRDLEKRDVPRDKGIKYVFVPCERDDYLYIKRVVRGLEPKLHARAADVRILHPDFIRYVQRIWMGLPQISPYFRPSTGSLMLFTALHAGCDSVQVYGMGYQPKYSLYYFDNEYRAHNISTSVHDLSKEISLVKLLHEAEIIDWYQRLT
ncbi:alpha-N-acetylgalactosaminide alpha-2,6-sialyltransferase 2-like isoform X2 [Acanthaster planci]|nr:alpha-N-acetylgalactosaminide alpha-2,6-sialyltransferase 2-like isoform X2 [Acanthaster planci]XP_022109115.1 alpha-N-acetylgalactosaminide alpha-2,6-sialyltransferase 2-like isoform X2 [Acanthaster planci]XP_022109116.1 alpha-N-acetylgalactosaminide alpha-2,6-sialyltransferase 2-like isoform X2 [Acanthaster planci]XP_022109117.1 alpha-N-acetylgalactosaminide alpha-2,6-sialyltransferase 2-like isoform X2 [Acanthaster planci]XP_022109118.1 alpha-N-acetylgalactosaminide alpha-2,6-sialyltransf